MDYITKATSRKALREMSVYFRKLFGVDETSPFPVLYAVERVPDVFPGSRCEIVPDNTFPPDTPARCRLDDDGNFLIEIKECIYDGAYKKHIGAYRGFIVHELCHVFLYKVGFTPVLNRSFDNGDIVRFCSVEWQAKALCGEVMMPYEATERMTRDEVMRVYGVSKGFADTRRRY